MTRQRREGQGDDAAEGTVDSDDEQEASSDPVLLDPGATSSRPDRRTALAHEGMFATAPGSHQSRPNALRAR